MICLQNVESDGVAFSKNLQVHETRRVAMENGRDWLGSPHVSFWSYIFTAL